MATLNDAVGRVDVSHRLMLEQRWVGRYTQPDLPRVDDHLFLNRLRYMLRLQTALNKPKMQDGALYAAAYNEVFLGFGENVNENVFDQNRLGLLMGYRFSKHFRLEGGFFQQLLQLGREVGGRNVFQYNNGVIVNANYTIDLRRKRR